MALKNCTVCGGSFSALGNAKTCSPECSKENTRTYNAEYWRARRPDIHARKIEREMETTQRALARFEREEEWNREYQRQYRAANRDRLNAQKRAWNKANRDKTRKWTRRWRARNAEAFKESSRAYDAAHREHRNELQRRRRRARASYSFE